MPCTWLCAGWRWRHDLLADVEWTEWTKKLMAAKERQKADGKDVSRMRPWERLRLRRKVAGSILYSQSIYEGDLKLCSSAPFRAKSKRNLVEQFFSFFRAQPAN